MTDILIDTAAKITFVLVDTSGVEVTGLGATFTLQVSKNGGAFGASAGTKAEIGSGWYSYTFAVAETDTAGPLAVKVTHVSIAQQNLLYDVVGSSWVFSGSGTYCSVADVKEELGITGSADDALIAKKIASAQKFFENKTGRLFFVTADTDRYLTVGKDTFGPDLYLPWDLCAITTILNDADNASPETLVLNTDYIVEPRNAGTTSPYYMLTLLPNSSKYWTYTYNPQMGIKITGRWGYSTTPPHDVFEAIVQLSAYLYRLKDSSVFDVTALPEQGVMFIPKGTPKNVVEVIMNYRRTVG